LTSRGHTRVNNEALSGSAAGCIGNASGAVANDRFAGHEILEYLLGDVDRAPVHGSYIREAYENGLAMQDTRGYNPYKFGVVSAGDSHSTAAAHPIGYFGVMACSTARRRHASAA
jgi:hypothetical protein